MDVTYYPVFCNLRYVHVVVDNCLAFVFVVAMTGKKVSHTFKAMKSAMLVMGLPWALKTNNGPAYLSQQFSAFIFSWRIRHSFGIPCNLQGQAIVERANCSLKGALARATSTESKRDPHLALLEVLFHANFPSLL
jgi:transposase InsO family protein